MSQFLIDNIIASSGINLNNLTTPSSASDPGTAGDIVWDSNYVYVCTATDTWKRLSLDDTAFTNGASSDPNFSSVSLLLHSDGSNGSTTFTDSSSNSLTVTANGDAQISTAQSKFGGSSMYLDGTGDSVSITDSGSVMVLGTDDFTVEFWFYTSSNSTNLTNFGTFFVGGINSLLLRYHSSYSGIVVGYEGVAYDIIPSPNASPTENAWNHIAVVRDSTSLRLYLNGSLVGDYTSTTRNYSSAINEIGKAGANYPLLGYIDDFRVTKGVARYTGSSFSVPTEAFPNS